MISRDKLPPIYVINLAISTERKQFMQQQFDDLQLPFKWEMTVDGLDLDAPTLSQYKQSVQAYKQWRNPKTNKKISRPDITKTVFACAASHLNIYQKIVDAQVSWSVIFEDDIILLEKQHFKTMLTYLTDLNLDCDIIFLDSSSSSGNNSILRRDKKKWCALSFFNRIRLPFAYTLGYFIHKPMGTYSYMVSLSGAQKMLQRNQPITAGADSALVAKYRTPPMHILASIHRC